MSRQVVLNIINQLFHKEIKKNPVGTEIARLIFLTRKWSLKSLELKGETDQQTIENINKWLDDFENMFRTGIVNINILAGYGGWAMARLPDRLSNNKDLFLESYKIDIERLINKDLTEARVLRNGLALRWKDNWEQFYNSFDVALKEGEALGLTTKEIIDGFIATDIFNDNVSLIDSAGKKWRPESYIEMYSRTRSSEMQDELLREEMLNLGMDIVRVSDHNTKTPICKQFEGKYFSLTGETRNIPLLKIKPPFHPNCLHYLIPEKRFNRSMISKNKRLDKQIKNFNKSLSRSDKKVIKIQTAWNIKNRL